jgi:hypothetical protein
MSWQNQASSVTEKRCFEILDQMGHQAVLSVFQHAPFLF